MKLLTRVKWALATLMVTAGLMMTAFGYDRVGWRLSCIVGIIMGLFHFAVTSFVEWSRKQ